MGQRITLFSDLSGDDIDGEAYKMILLAPDKRRGVFLLDISEKEFDSMREKGTKTNHDTIKDLGLVA